MKDVRRGYMHNDERLFGAQQAYKVLRAASDARWLINRGYHLDSAVTFAANHYLLTARQRMAIRRSILPDTVKDERRRKELSMPASAVLIDGFNVLITLETALSGSIVLKGDDGALRDVAGLHGSYRLIEKTPLAITLLLNDLIRSGVREATVLLDKPVSNSGSLKRLILEKAKGTTLYADVLLVDNPDNYMKEQKCVISADGPVLDGCGSWYNLNAHIISVTLPQAWIFSFGT